MLCFAIEHFVLTFISKKIFFLRCFMGKSWYILGLCVLISCQSKQEVKISMPLPAKKNTESPVIQTATVEEVKALFDTAQKQAALHPDSAIALYREALSMSKHIPYPKGVASAYNNLGICFQQKEDFETANRYFNDGISYLRRVVASPLLAGKNAELQDLYNCLLHFYKSTYQPDEIIRTFNVARPLFNNLSDSLQKDLYTRMNYALGWAYWELDRYDSATTIYLSLIDQYRPVNRNNYAFLVTSYVALGGISAKIQDRTKAIHYFNQAAQLAQIYNDSALYTGVIHNTATLFYEQKQYKKAKYYALKVLDQAQYLSPKFRIDYQFYGAYTMAVILMEEGKPAEAMPYSKMALEKANENPLIAQKISAFYILGSNYAKCKDYKKAEEYLYSGLRLAKANNFMDDMASISGQLGIVYARMGDYPKAYQYKSSYITIRDSLRGKENTGRIAAVNAKYHLAQKDRELVEKQLQMERQRKKQYLWGGAALFSIMILTGLLWRKQHKAAMNELRATLAGEEKERARMAMELHDGIVSRLSMIKINFSALPQYYEDNKESAAFQDTIRQLDMSIDELRSTAHNLLPQMLVQEGLIATIDNYCKKISKTAEPDITFLSVGMLPTLTHEFQLNIYRIIQELLQNIVKHAGATQALVQLTIREDELEVTVDDNGIGANMPDYADHKQGIGLNNLQSRVKVLNGKMKIEQDKGTSVYLVFDLKKFKTG